MEKLLVHKNHGGMSFKDLATFNVAMLGKQGWKLQTDSDSLASTDATIISARK